MYNKFVQKVCTFENFEKMTQLLFLMKKGYHENWIRITKDKISL